MISKKILVPVMAVAGAGIILFGVSQAVNAQSGNTFYSGLAKAISDKFHLDQGQVQSTIDQYGQQQKSTRQQMMQDRLSTRLDQLIQQGKLKSSQKQAVLDEFNKLKSEYNPANFRNLTPTQRQQKFQQLQTELKSWSQSQGIDLSLLPGFGLGRGMRGMGWGMHKGIFGQTATPTPTP